MGRKLRPHGAVSGLGGGSDGYLDCELHFVWNSNNNKKEKSSMAWTQSFKIERQRGTFAWILESSPSPCTADTSRKPWRWWWGMTVMLRMTSWPINEAEVRHPTGPWWHCILFSLLLFLPPVFLPFLQYGLGILVQEWTLAGYHGRGNAALLPRDLSTHMRTAESGEAWRFIF